MAHEIKRSLYARISSAHQFLGRILDSFWSSVVSFFSRLRAPFDKLKNAIYPQNNPEEKGEATPKHSPIIPNVVPAPPRDEKTRKTVYVHTPWWKTLLEVAAVGIVAWYTFEAHKANTISKNSMRQSQRPWIGPDTKQPIRTGPIIISNVGFISTTYEMSAINYGSYGANNVNFWAQLYIAQDISTIQKRAHYACEVSTQNPELGEVMFPTQGRWMVSPKPALAMDIIRNKKANPPYKTYQAYLLTCIGYRDQFGIPHHTGTIFANADPATGNSSMFELSPNQSLPVNWQEWSSFLD